MGIFIIRHCIHTCPQHHMAAWLIGNISARPSKRVCVRLHARAFSAKYVWKMESLKQLLPVYTNHRVA